MDEADALCSRIGIVTNGRLRCIGAGTHLKGIFGDGFKLNLNLTHDYGSPHPAHQALNAAVVKFIHSIVPEAVFTPRLGKTVYFTLPKNTPTSTIINIFNCMEVSNSTPPRVQCFLL